MLKMTTFASGSDGNMFLLENEETKIMVECGLDKTIIRKNLSSKNLLLTDLDCCLVSHFHQDHCKSIDYIMEYIDVYSNHEVAKNKGVKVLKPLETFNVGTISILPIIVEHGSAENYAYIFKDKKDNDKLFFGTDFSLMKQNVSKIGFSKIFIELNYDDTMMKEILNNEDEKIRNKFVRQISTHMSKENCKEHLRHMNLTKCEEIHLLHCSKFLLNKKNVQEEFEQEFKVKIFI